MEPWERTIERIKRCARGQGRGRTLIDEVNRQEHYVEMSSTVLLPSDHGIEGHDSLTAWDHSDWE